MKSKILVTLALAGVVVMSPVVRAADTPAPSQPANAARGGAIREHMKAVAKELGLTDQQQQQLKPVLKAEAEKLKALRADQSLSRQEKRDKMKALREENVAQMKSVLTPDQFAKWQKLRQERQGKTAPAATQS
ncbi:MAG TPA: hypothetical protein VMC06_14400 [Opitutaceae bacterium]|nr:hypothetical protein [Opitutaceae bacterium]